MKRTEIEGWKGCLTHPPSSLQAWPARTGFHELCALTMFRGFTCGPCIEFFQHPPPELQVICLHFIDKGTEAHGDLTDSAPQTSQR